MPRLGPISADSCFFFSSLGSIDPFYIGEQYTDDRIQVATVEQAHAALSFSAGNWLVIPSSYCSSRAECRQPLIERLCEAYMYKYNTTSGVRTTDVPATLALADTGPRIKSPPTPPLSPPHANHTLLSCRPQLFNPPRSWGGQETSAVNAGEVLTTMRNWHEPHTLIVYDANRLCGLVFGR